MRSIAKELHKKRILITGGDGFLGRYLLSQLKQLYDRVYLYEKDVRDIFSLNKHYDVVCHLAGLTKVDSKKRLKQLFDVNVIGTQSVMDYCRKTAARCVMASSSAVYKPLMSNRLLRENSIVEPDSLYGVSKMLAENICKSYAKNFDISVLALRIFNMYGPGQRTPFLMPYVIAQLFNSKPVTLKTPNAVRDFVFVTDVARAFINSCVAKNRGFTVLNVGTGKSFSVNHIVQKITRQLKSTVRVNNEMGNNSIEDYVTADIKKTIKHINWRPLISIDKGIELLCR